MGDRYNPLYELGAGAFGTAWVVKDNRTQRKCVSKVIQIKGLSSTALDRCVTEVAVLSTCSHTNIVRYMEAFVSGGALHIMMEYASGGDLQQKIEKQNGIFFTSDVILEWFLQVIMALEYIHSKNILHRDLKPQNIFLTENGVVKLGDFGIARVLSSCDDLASTRIGTPFYISPEICQRKPYNSSSDMWAAGCLLYQICTLRVPFHASNFDDLTKEIIKAEYVPIPCHFSPVIQLMLSKLLVTTPSSRLSASQLLNMDSVHGMVLYLKHKYHMKGQVSRTRSTSLVTDRSRTQIGQKPRSSSVNRYLRNCEQKCYETLATDLQVIPQNKNMKYNSDMIEPERRNVSDNRATKLSRKNSCLVENISKSDKQNRNRSGHEQQIRSITKGSDRCINSEDKTWNRATTHDEPQRFVATGVVEENSVLNNDVVEGGGKITSRNRSGAEASRKNRINSRTFTIKDSVARRLSEASPRLSLTVRKQRFSVSISDQVTSDEKNTSQNDREDVVDDVFQSPDINIKGKVNSHTYILKERGHSDANNNSVMLDSSVSNVDSAFVHTTMIQALSVSKVNKELAESILLKEIGVRVGTERCDQLISQVKKLIVKEGQSYEHLRSLLTDAEQTLIPLICMYLFH